MPKQKAAKTRKVFEGKGPLANELDIERSERNALRAASELTSGASHTPYDPLAMDDEIERTKMGPLFIDGMRPDGNCELSEHNGTIATMKIKDAAFIVRAVNFMADIESLRYHIANAQEHIDSKDYAKARRYLDVVLEKLAKAEGR